VATVKVQDTRGVPDQPREQTDESLRVEREQADAEVEKKQAAVEKEADKVVRTARHLADEVVQDARKDADLAHPPSAGGAGDVERERARADVLLDETRSKEDASLLAQREERNRYLASFLAVEREATDADLTRERDHSDSLVEARDEFLATVSHDMRNLLAGLGVNATLLFKDAPDGPEGDSVRRHAAASQRLVARLDRLVNDLLDVASIDAGKLGLRPERVDVGKILRETLDAFEPIALTKGVTLDGAAAEMPVDTQLDGGRVLQVLANVVSNALKFTPSGGRISISVVSDKDQLQFSVTDNGIGIPAEALPTVFERFRQVRPDRRGLGLGLHISKCIVEAHGGRMWAESKLGAGSTFYFSLPSSPAAVAPKK
jgi:signal transduction histidine kinase